MEWRTGRPNSRLGEEVGPVCLGQVCPKARLVDRPGKDNPWGKNQDRSAVTIQLTLFARGRYCVRVGSLSFDKWPAYKNSCLSTLISSLRKTERPNIHHHSSNELLHAILERHGSSERRKRTPKLKELGQRRWFGLGTLAPTDRG